MALNYLPFQRREVVTVPPKLAARVLTGGFSVTNLSIMATGGTYRAIVQDIIMQQIGADLLEDGSRFIRARIGVDGQNYLTEDLYDYRVFMDVGVPLAATWDWSCGGRTPYRLYPGQKMRVLMSRSLLWSQQTGTYPPVSVCFNGLKVKHGSPVGTKEDVEPLSLYATLQLPTTAQAGELYELDSVRMQCPKDSPVDLYSVTVPECYSGVAGQIVYILDGNDRPFWQPTTLTNMIDIMASPISLGYGGIVLEPDEKIRVELQNGDVSVTTDTTMWVTYRGVLEVADGR